MSNLFSPIAALVIAAILLGVGIRLFFGRPSGGQIAVGVSAILIALAIAVPAILATIVIILLGELWALPGSNR